MDCDQQDTKEISRNKADLKTDGIILFGQEIDGQDYFDGAIQHLSIVGNPGAAYSMCTDYVPDCAKPLPPDPLEKEQQDALPYQGRNEDDILDREGLSPQQYLEFTERLQGPPKQEVAPSQVVEPTFVSTPGEPGPRGEPGVGTWYLGFTLAPSSSTGVQGTSQNPLFPNPSRFCPPPTRIPTSSHLGQ